MLASPIINPIVLLSTYYAFYKTNPEIFYFRLLFGIGIALIIGIIMGIIFNKKNVTLNNISCECEHDHLHPKGLKYTLKAIVKHTALDMFEVVKYLMIGAFIASICQVLLPRSILNYFNDNQILSVLVLMLFAYLISLCSTSDSFIGRTLLSSFSKSSILAYLLLGPMIDVKNTFVLCGNYKKSFTITLITLIFVIIFIFSMIGVIVL